MTAILNQIAEKWFSWQLSMFWQVGLLIAIVAGLDLLIKKWVWPQVRYALWLLILVKLVLPPTLTSPTSFTAEIPFMVKQTVIKISQPQTSPRVIKSVIVPVTEPIPADTTTQPMKIVLSAPTATPTPAASVAPVASLSSKTYVFLIWLAGAGILSGWLIIRLSNLRHQHLDKQSNLPERLEDLLVSTARKLGLRKVPKAILTNKVCCPAVFGIFRPVLLMPADKLQNLTTQDAEHIFLHELAHIKRGDLFVHAVYMILQIAYWFNPLLWLIRKNLQNLRELCCDATVARLLKEKTIGYRQTLLETARQLLAEPVDPGLGLLGLFENSSWLVDRLRWLEKKSWKNRPLRITTIFVLISLMTACVLPMANPGPPKLVIKGIVTDLQTGKPIAGTKVFDDGYGPAPEWSKIRPDQRAEWGAITNSKGEYSFLTWPEHHSIKAEVAGFKARRKTLYNGHFTLNKKDEEIFDFALEPEKSSSEATIGIKQIMELAKEKARSLNHEYIGTEHILLVIAEEKGVASDILRNSGIDEDKILVELLKVIKKGPKPVTKKTLPVMPRAQQAIDYAVQQAGGEHNLNTGHILLGLMQAEDGVAAQVLKNLGLEKEKVINFALEPNAIDKNSQKVSVPIVRICEPQIDPNREDMQILTGEQGEEGALSGKVVDEKGNPLKDVLITIWNWHKDSEIYTNANGYFYLGGCGPEQKTIGIKFSKEGFTPKYLIRQPLGIKDTVVILDDKTYFEGTVTTSDGKPVPNAAIRADAGPKDCEGVVVTAEPTECTSDKNGYYRLYVQADNYDIQVKTEQGVIRLQNVRINKDEAKKLDLKLGQAITFLAKVIDSQTKEPVSGLRLFSWSHPGIEGVSDSNGLVQIPNMLPGKFAFWAESKEYGRWWSEDCLSEWGRYKIDDEKTGWQRNFDNLDFDLKDGMKPVTIIVEKGVKIRGKVIDPAGNPVEGATVSLAKTGSGNSITGDTRYNCTTDTNGQFEMMAPASKKVKYNLVAHDGKYEQWRNWANGVLEPIQTNPGDIIENVIIKLTKPATVKGIVVDDSGKAVPNNLVRASAFDKLENRYYDPTSRTDVNGNFEIKFIRPGKHYIQAHPFWLSAEQSPEGTSQVVTVSENQLLEGIRLTKKTVRPYFPVAIAQLARDMLQATINLHQLKAQNASQKEINEVENRIEMIGKTMDEIGNNLGWKMEGTGEQLAKKIEALAEKFDEKNGEQFAEQIVKEIEAWGEKFSEQFKEQFDKQIKSAGQGKDKIGENSQKSANPIDFEITKQAFLPGDSIEITEISGSADKIQTGQIYTVKGKYKLSSSDKAVLNIYATNGNIESEQGPVVKRGTGDFSRTFTYSRDGWLHLSFYPADGGSSFGSLYFAQKGSGQKIPDLSNITDVISVGTSKPAGAENVDLYIADFQIRPYEAGGLYTVTAKIGNHGTATVPPFRMNFFRGDPKDKLNLHGKPQSGSYGAGPIKPGEFWNEQSSPFALKEGINELSVVLDTDNSIAETNELNNSTTVAIDVEGSRIEGEDSQKPVGQNKVDNETDKVSESSVAEKKVNAARTLRITIYEGNDVEPQTSVRIPLIAMKIVRQLLPSKDKLQIIAQKIKLDENLPQDMNSQDLIEMLDEMLTKLDEGVPSTTLLEVKDGDERIIIALE